MPISGENAIGVEHVIEAQPYRNRAVTYASGEPAIQAAGITACRRAIETKNYQVVSVWTDPQCSLLAGDRPGLTEAINRVAWEHARMIFMPFSTYDQLGSENIEWSRERVSGFGGEIVVIADDGVR